MTPNKIVPFQTPEPDPFSPEAREREREQQQREREQWKREWWERDRRYNRWMLVGVLAIPTVITASWFTSRYAPTVALVVFGILPLSVMVSYLVWKGWLEKPPNGL